MLLLSLGTNATEMSNLRTRNYTIENNTEGKSYFVVIGSFRSLYEAKQFVESSDLTYYSVVYEINIKGERWYRVVYSSCKSRAEAERELAIVREDEYGVYPYGGWIWTYTGGARLVYRGSGK